MKGKIEENRGSSGITLIALIITIIILLILAGITLKLISEGGLFRKAEEATFLNKMASYKEKVELYVMGKKMDTLNSDVKWINSGEPLKQLIKQEIITDITVEDVTLEMDEMIQEITQEEEEYLVVYKGELCYVSDNKIPNNQQKAKWCESVGIKILKGLNSEEGDNKQEGIQIRDGSYELVNGVYLCTPKLDAGFVKEKTRYLEVDSNGNLVAGNWIMHHPSENWYSYKEQKWANIYVESNGVESYYVWIPRYVYKNDQTNSVKGNERMDVKFVDLDNSYIDAETNQKITWEELQSHGYQVPEAFSWGDKEDSSKNVPMSGYWMSKYQLSELTNSNQYIVDFETIAAVTSITIQGIKINSTKQVAKYIYAINGNIVHESTNGENFTAKGLSKGNKTINVTAVDANGSIIGSMTKLYEVADVNPPDLTGFDKDTTFYVYWDENGIEHNEVPVSKNPPEEWYDYGARSWANIVTRNNGIESYFVWIPRYQYKLDQVSKRSYVKFIKGTSQEVDTGYQIPEAFTWGDKSEVQLTGYWMSKYQLSKEESTAKVDAEMAAGSSVIRIKEIRGSVVTKDLKYEYYLNGEKVHEGNDSRENYVYTGLTANTTYAINIILKRADGNYVGAITKKITTTEANKPELTGYNADKTYYVLYDETGNMTVGDKIKNDGSNIPEGWYDYSKSKWANIVVTNGSIQNGKIIGGTNTSYFVWIPRYEYRILPDRADLSTANRRIEVNFLQGNSGDATPGYQIPEAFYWGDNNSNYKENKPITGYWISKYQLSN